MIYFIRFRDAEPVKIGRSGNPPARLATLRSQFHVDLSIVRVIKGLTYQERWLHRHYLSRHIWGEWFRFHPDMMEIVPPETPPFDVWPAVCAVTGNRFYDDRLFVDFRPSTGGGYLGGHTLKDWTPEDDKGR